VEHSSNWNDRRRRIPISKEFVSAAMRLPSLIAAVIDLLPPRTKGSSPDEDFQYVWEELEVMLQWLARKADTGVLISASGELPPYMREEMKESFGLYGILAWKPTRLLARDFRRDIRKNGPIHYVWASFDLLPDGSVVWQAHKQPHDPGLPPPEQKVHVSLPASRQNG
jgi:hypothetical protein